MSDTYHQGLRSQLSELPTQPTEEIVKDAIQNYPTILFLHGAAGTRATSWRVSTYRGLTSRLQTNVFVIEYRGFGDSTGSPSPEGLELDAYTAWSWLLERGAKPENVVVVGHSLGTGVAGQFMKRLAGEGLAPRGVALLAPFSSLGVLVETYHVFGVPILQPLQTFPLGLSTLPVLLSSFRTLTQFHGKELLKRLIRHEFDTLSAIPEFNAPTLIAHSQDDMEIPNSHSKTLIDKFLEPLLPTNTVQLPSAPGKHLSTEELLAWRQQQEARSAKRGEIVRRTDIPNFGTIEEFKGLQAPVVYVETFWGSHSRIGVHEGVQDQMAKLFSLGPYSGTEDSMVDMLVNRIVS